MKGKAFCIRGLLIAVAVALSTTHGIAQTGVPFNGTPDDPGALWDPETIVVIESINSTLFTTNELSEPVVVLPVVKDVDTGPGFFAFTIETLDRFESKLIRGIVDSDGFNDGIPRESAR